MCVASIWIWFKLTGLNNGCLFFCSHHIFSDVATNVYWAAVETTADCCIFSHQPWSLFNRVWREKKHLILQLALFLFLSTVKPQNSVIPVAYLLILWLPSMGDKHRTKSVWLGFAVMFVVSLLLTQWLVPGWVGEFFRVSVTTETTLVQQVLSHCGARGCYLCACLILFVIVAMAIGILSYRVRRHEAHLIAFSYMLILQGLVFPSHLYTVMMGIPIVILSLGRLIRMDGKTNKYYTYVISVVLILTFCAVYKYWIHILSEAPLPDGI